MASGLTRATPVIASRSSATPSSAAIGPDRGDEHVARHDVGDPGARRRPGALADRRPGRRPASARRPAAPMVRVARPRSRSSDARASRSSRRNGRRNGSPPQPGEDRDQDRAPAASPRAGRRRPRRARIAPAAPASRGQTRRPATATATNTTTSQRSRARRASGRSIRARSASTGAIRAARRAGSRAAASVTRMPTTTATSAAGQRQLGRIERDAADRPQRRRPSGSRAEPRAGCRAPSRRPRATSAWMRMNERTWPRVAPAARSRPTSRTRSMTVIESVLKMRKAPVNRAIAAIIAVVAWKSAVEARSEAARSAGGRDDVRLDEQPSSRRRR